MRAEAVECSEKFGMVFRMIPVYAHDVLCCSRPGKPAIVCSLLLRDKKTEVLPDECMG